MGCTFTEWLPLRELTPLPINVLHSLVASSQINFIHKQEPQEHKHITSAYKSLLFGFNKRLLSFIAVHGTIALKGMIAPSSGVWFIGSDGWRLGFCDYTTLVS